MTPRILDRIVQRATKAARRNWMKYALKGVSRADNYAKLDLAYQVADPWVMHSPAEQFRFQETNRIITEQFGDIHTLLEIGCGEGHQSSHLAPLCEQLYGLDVSETAVTRARDRVPAAQFAACDLQHQPFRDRFDAIVACEVLYYMKDIRGTLERMSAMADRCLLTYFEPAGRHLDAEISAIPGCRTTTFTYEDTTWIAAWWKPCWP